VPEKQHALFETGAELFVPAAPGDIYPLVSDLRNSPLWSTECTGGEWVSGEPGEVGSVFRGDNERSADVVAWAPVARGRWSTYAEVVRATPGEEFAWAIRDRAGRAQDSVWSFTITPVEGGSLLAHRFRMGRPTEGIREITSGMSEVERERFRQEWAGKLTRDLSTTVRRIKTVLETRPVGARTGEV
jgi:polyketide cyclase/dehydrase/lipid transport protein